MGTFIDSIKNLFNGLTAKTQSTASTSDYIQLYNGTTGEPNGKIKLDILAAVLGGCAMEIPEASDLDNFKAVGDYFCGTSQRAQSLYNCPTTSSFMLEVRPTNAGEDKTKWVRRLLSEDIPVNIVFKEEKKNYCMKKKFKEFSKIILFDCPVHFI